MKNYNKILEAVNRGIQLALDDFDDEDEVQNIRSKQIQNRDYTKEYLDLLKYEVVDLGLPSRTLWCKYNLDVNPNQLSNSEDWYGGYYAWGEIKANKSEYGLNNYKYNKSKTDDNELTKYCSDSKKGLNGFTDNLTELLPEDDAAYQNKKFYNFKFYIPTKKQCEELINYTNNYWVDNYDPNKLVHNSEDDGGILGLNGRIFEGKNGNQLFIPAAGYHSSSGIYSVGFNCYLWSSGLRLGGPNQAYYLEFNLDDIGKYSYNRCFSFTIRPVINL